MCAIVLLAYTNLIVGTEVENQYTSTTVNFRARTDAGTSATLRSGSIAVDVAQEHFVNVEDGPNTFPLEFREDARTSGLGKTPEGSKARPLT